VRNNPADTKVSEEGRGGFAPGAGAETHLQPKVDYGGEDCIPWRTPPEQVDALRGSCDPVGNPFWSRLLAGPVDLPGARSRAGLLAVL